jgi:hypothetical protein
MAEARDAERQLVGFMAKFSDEVADLADKILGEMRRLYPSALELVYDNYNALAIGFGPTERSSEAIFSIAVFPRWVSLFFLQAKGLPDPEKILRGSGSVARHVVLPSAAMLYSPAVQELMREAVTRAKVPLDPRAKHRLIIKSVSAKQRPRRPANEGNSIQSPSRKRSKGKKSEVGAR